MWGVNAAAPLNSVHLGYGLGAVFTNLLVRPFITEKVLSIDGTNNEGINSTLSMGNLTKVNPNIVIPYSITAILCFLIAVGHIFFYVSELRNRRQKLQVQQVIINPREKIELVNKCNAYI
jgi:fucose permease